LQVKDLQGLLFYHFFTVAVYHRPLP